MPLALRYRDSKVVQLIRRYLDLDCCKVHAGCRHVGPREKHVIGRID